MLTPDTPALRNPLVLYRAVDNAHTSGRFTGLRGPVLAAWVADELTTHMAGSMHLFSQHLLNHGEADFDGPGVLAGFGEALLSFDEDCARYCRWVALRAVEHAKREVNESFASITNAVGHALIDSMREACDALLARWPDSLALEPFMPKPLEVSAPRESMPHYPNAVLSVERCLEGSARTVIDLACAELWRHGADDATLEMCEAELLEAEEQLPEALGQWLSFSECDPPLEDMRAKLFPPDPLALFLGAPARRGLNLADADRFDEARAALEPHGFRTCCGEFMDLRAAVRFDPPGLLLRAEDCTEDDVELLAKLLLLEFTIVCLGEARWLDALGSSSP